MVHWWMVRAGQLFAQTPTALPSMSELLTVPVTVSKERPVARPFAVTPLTVRPDTPFDERPAPAWPSPLRSRPVSVTFCPPARYKALAQAVNRLSAPTCVSVNPESRTPHAEQLRISLLPNVQE